MPPEITLLGPKTITLRSCSWLTLDGEPFPCVEERDYAAELAALMKKMPWVLCEGQQGSTCYFATDRQGRETVRLNASSLTVGPAELIPSKGPHKHFKIPHDAIDAAGNRATTKYREVSLKASGQCERGLCNG